MWLLEPATRRVFEQALKAGIAPTAEQQAQFEARYNDAADGGLRILSVAGDTAEIRINGVMTKAPHFLSMLFGGGNTTYPEIAAAIAEAERNSDVNRIVLSIYSGGGEFYGLFDTLAALQSATKPISAVIADLGASAAYAIASQADTISAANRAARIGSIGVAATFFVYDDEVDIASTQAPKKRPDVTTDEGVAMVREELDAMHALFVEAIAAGRDTTTDTVNAEFGQGATLLADDALKRGMIDDIAGPGLRVVGGTASTTARSGGTQPEIRPMDLATLKAQHPDLYAAVVQAGVMQERDRVTAHLIMGEQSGAMETAAKAIKEGAEMTATLQATYLTAGMNRGDIDRRDQDNAGAGAADKPDGQTGTDDTAVVSLVEAQLGISKQ